MAKSSEVMEEENIDYRKPANDNRNLVQIGHLVSSVQGRDSGKFYLVVEIEEARIKVADGECRKVENPKRKNLKHLKVYDVVAGILNDKAQSGKKITNADVRKELESLVESL